MKRICLLALVILAAGIVGCGAKPPAAPQADKDAVVKANHGFAFDLYGQLRRGDGNLFFSPASISTALAMTSAGARGETAEQMKKTLHSSLDQERLHPAVAAVNWGLTHSEGRGVQLHLANALWGQKGYPFLSDFLKLTRGNYGAGLQETDFRADPEGARRAINAWVEKQTQEKIQELFQPGILNANTRLVLANAIYFKANWAHPFEKHRTRAEPFLLGADQKVSVPMMHQEGEFPYAASDGLRLLELPYVGDSLSMVVLLPEKVDGLAALEQTLTADKLADWLARLHPQRMEVSIPQFRFTAEFQLNDTLSAMGMSAAFDPQKADFSGLDGQRDLFLTAVVHKAFVDVNEEGTEAAAATGVAAGKLALPPSFRADHPFVFLIRDKRSGSILFLGRLIDPRKPA